MYFLWETIKVSGKVKSYWILNFAEKDELIDHNKKITNGFNDSFVNFVLRLNIVLEKSNAKLTELHLHEVNMPVIKYKTHTSIKAINITMVELNNPTFSLDK